MRKQYEIVQTRDGPAWIKSSRIAQFQEVDAIAYDCDGVLVDARKSYNATIPMTADQLLRMTTGLKLSWNQIAPRTITLLRQTGCFNNDWDTTYALTLFSILALPLRVVQGIVASPSRVVQFNPQRVVTEMIAVVKKFSSNLKGNSIPSEAVDRFVRNNTPNKIYRQVIATLKAQLGYPGTPPDALLPTLFDEIYHGPALFRRMYGVDARHNQSRGLIENERILIKPHDLNKACRIIGGSKLAIITGRPYLATKYVLRDLLDYFNVKASLFIGDIDVHPELATKLAPYRKPSSLSLAHARRVLGSHMLLYVGDSAEDVEMVKNAQAGEPVLSASVYGTGLDQSERLKFFIGREVDMILPTARRVPNVLRLVKN
ncbi:MAG: hypothetical protein ABSF09_01625 [Candidatus Bathyarchaeia archaeon]